MIEQIKSVVNCIFYGLLLSLSACSSTNTINAQTEELSIVIKPVAAVSERFAAEELQRYLKKVTGQKVPICAQASEGTAALFIGDCGSIAGFEKPTLGEEDYCLQSVSGGLVLAGGGPRGTLYAVYDFLERLGCRWYFIDPEDEIVPQLSSTGVASIIRSGLRVTERPDFSVRMYRFLTYDLGPEGTALSAAIMKSMPDTIDWLAKNRINIFQFALDHNWNPYAHWQHYRDTFPEMRKRSLTIGAGGHCMFMPDDKFKEHPDWFPMINGKRQAKGQFCTRNEEAVRFYADNLIRFLKDNPEIEYFAPWPNDIPPHIEPGGGWCRCPLCKDTSSFNRYMEFGNRIYTELKRAVPNVRFTHFAYGGHLTPPEKQRPLPELTVTICTWGRDFSVPFDDARTRQHFRDVFARWRQMCTEAKNPLILHDKYARHFLLGFHPLPLPVMQEDLRWFRRQGIDGFELPCGYMGRRTKSFNLYVLSRLMWDADADVDAIVDDYFNRCYGESAAVMRKAYEEVELSSPNLHYWSGNCVMKMAEHKATKGSYSPEWRNYASNAVTHIEQAQGYVQEALSAANDSEVRARIARFGQSVAYVVLQWQGLSHIIEATLRVAEADTARARTSAEYTQKLDAAEHCLQRARKISNRREQMLTKEAGCGLYWDPIETVQGHWVFMASQIDDWLKVVSEKRKAGCEPPVKPRAK